MFFSGQNWKPDGSKKKKTDEEDKPEKGESKRAPFCAPLFFCYIGGFFSPSFLYLDLSSSSFLLFFFKQPKKVAGGRKKLGEAGGRNLKKSPGGRNPSFFPSSVDSSPIGIGLVGWWRVLFPPPPFSHGPLAASPPFSFSRSPPSSSPPFMDERAIRKRKRGNWTEGGGSNWRG